LFVFQAAVVGQKQNQRTLGQPQPIDGRHDAPDALVKLLQQSGIRSVTRIARLRLLLLVFCQQFRCG
jgi:hypothetical protein